MSSKWSIPALMAANRGFIPTDISGLKLWLRADAISGLNDGDAISLWPDTSGNSNNATQSSTARPVYKTSIVNGKPVVRFDGSDDYFNLASPVSSVLPYTVFIVYKKRTTGVSFVAIGYSGDSTPYPWLDFSDDNSYISSRGNSQFFHDPSYSSAFTLISIISQSSDNEALWVNGVSGPIVSIGGSSSNNNFDVIGRRIGTFADGDLAEFLIYDSALSTINRQNIESYLRIKYATP